MSPEPAGSVKDDHPWVVNFSYTRGTRFLAYRMNKIANPASSRMEDPAYPLLVSAGGDAVTEARSTVSLILRLRQAGERWQEMLALQRTRLRSGLLDCN